MKPQSFSWPVDPLVAKNKFRDRVRRRQVLPVFEQVRSRLPAPVLPHLPEWEEMYWRAWEVFLSRLRASPAAAGLPSPYVSNSADQEIVLWDAAFLASLGATGRRIFDTAQLLDNFYARQHDHGFISRQLNAKDGSDYFAPFDPNGSGPNILAWAEWRIFRQTGNTERLSDVFWPLLAQHRWFRTHRTWPTGLYWSTGLSSGMEGQPRVPDSRLLHQHWTWVDANIQASLSCWVLAQMAHMLDQDTLAAELVKERAFLIREINSRMWNGELNFYQDIDPGGNFARDKSIGAYWALLDKSIVPKDRLSDFIYHLHDPNAFRLVHRIPSISADSPGFDPENVMGWCGAVSPAANAMVLRGLRSIGHHQLAHEIAENHLRHVSQTFQHTDLFLPAYSSTGVARESAQAFEQSPVTAMAVVAVMFEQIVGIHVDWPLRRITWDMRLPQDCFYGVRNYPLGVDGKLDMVGDGREIVVNATVPFSLTVHLGDQTIQTGITRGETRVKL